MRILGCVLKDFPLIGQCLLVWGQTSDVVRSEGYVKQPYRVGKSHLEVEAFKGWR